MNPAGDLRPLGEAVRLYGPDYATRDEIHITGLEDLRLRRGPDGGLLVSGTCLDTAGLPTAAGGAPMARIATATLLPDAGVLIDFECLEEPFPGRYEKNWVPIEDGSQACRRMWLYSAWEDGAVATVNRVQGSWIVLRGAPSPFALRHLRGRSQLIAYRRSGDRLLGIFGEATDDGRRMYDHRFVEFSNDLYPLRWSPPFRFGPLRGVEFVAGLEQIGRRLVVSYGLRDEEAWLATLDVDDVADSLTDIPC
jgi:hypothetical protein